MKILVLHSDIGADPPPEELDTLIAAEAVGSALIAQGHDAPRAAFVKDAVGFAELIADIAPDLVFNLVEGVEGRGELAPLAPRLLAEIGMRFTGVGATAMDVTNDKPLTKRMLRGAGLATPDWSEPPIWDGIDEARYIVKSALEDASLGLDDSCVVTGAAAVKSRAAACTARLGGSWFAERFVDGREFNIAMLGGADSPRILPMAEMRFDDWPPGKPRIVGYEAKWDEASTGWHHTARVFGVERDEPALAARLRDACLRVWALFDLRGFVRVDFRVTEDAMPLILEINTNPCISPDAGFAAAAAEAGMSYEALIAAIVAVAPHCPPT